MAKKEKSKHPFRDSIEVVIFAIVMALGLKVFAVEAYQIPTGSMMPTLMGTQLIDPDRQIPNGSVHDRVLVDKISWWLREPNRWEVVVFRYPLLAHQNYVKRMVGMPGEDLAILNGDIWTRKDASEEYTIERKPDDLQATLWKSCWPVPGSDETRWMGWETGNQSPGKDGLMKLGGRRSIQTTKIFHDDYRDGFPDSIHWRIPVTGAGVRSRNVVSDLKLESTFIPDNSAGPLEIRLDAGPFPIRLLLDSQKEESIILHSPDGEVITGSSSLAAGENVEVEIAFWDHRLHVSVHSGGQHWAYALNLELEAQQATMNRIRFTAQSGGWSVMPPKIFRDIHYLPPLRGGGAPYFTIPEGNYFMMGDNTQNSHDSRDWEARELELDPPVDGRHSLRGDNFHSGSDPNFDNPRWNVGRNVMTFRDLTGEQFLVPKDSIARDERVHSPLVPREHLMGRALAVFMPLWPTLRVGFVR
ncbi:MAG: signal peptidase I [Planctomycetota bacterium]|jgi:signal peptidase I|nr:signal peptidase I [Planctomycetota bacterium]MDP6941386.1 signal peptidase I [Planctomycetota bacterium]